MRSWTIPLKKARFYFFLCVYFFFFLTRRNVFMYNTAQFIYAVPPSGDVRTFFTLNYKIFGFLHINCIHQKRDHRFFVYTQYLVWRTNFFFYRTTDMDEKQNRWIKTHTILTLYQCEKKNVFFYILFAAHSHLHWEYLERWWI